MATLPGDVSTTVQSPLHDGIQSQEIADVPQVLLTQSAKTAPPARTTQISPAAHVVLEGLGQATVAHALVVTTHRGADTPPTHVALVTPAPAQSS